MKAADFVRKDYIDRKDRIGYASFWWWRGTDASGQSMSFRFSKGGDPKYFDLYVHNANFVNVDGPFKTRRQAQGV